MPILGEPMLFRQIERLERSREIDQLIVATSTDASDDEVVQACAERDVACHRGSLDDVLKRYVQAAEPYAPGIVVRLTGDCPLADPHIIDEVIRFFRAGDYDYASNCMPPTFPDGLDVEVMRFSCLQDAEQEAVLPSHREHVTPFLRAYPDRFRAGNYVSSEDRSTMRWTVDELEDFEFVRNVYEKLYPTKLDFTTWDILDLLGRQPELQAMNSGFKRNNGKKNSLKADIEFISRKT
jgi:spore coat polysaccharide biosynthesis protein SpsF (cytidylyltransferase family)